MAEQPMEQHQSFLWGKWVQSFNLDPFYRKLHKKWSFLLKISSVNVATSAVSCGFACGFGHIYWKNPLMKNFIFLCSVKNWLRTFSEATNNPKYIVELVRATS